MAIVYFVVRLFLNIALDSFPEFKKTNLSEIGNDRSGKSIIYDTAMVFDFQ